MTIEIINSKIDTLGITCRKTLADYSNNRVKKHWLWGSPGAIWGYELADVIMCELDDIVLLISDEDNFILAPDYIDLTAKALYLIIKNYLVEMISFELSKNLPPYKMEYYKLLICILKIRELKTSESFKNEFEKQLIIILSDLFKKLEIVWYDDILDVENILKNGIEH